MMKMKNRLGLLGVSPVIAVILMVAITVVLSGMLWALLQFNSPEPKAANITASTQDRPYYWVITISTSGSNDFYLEDVKFQVISYQKTLEYELTTNDADPKSYKKDLSVVYPLTLGSTVMDNSTSAPVTGASEFIDYENCYIAFIDEDADNMLNPGDTIYLYKDYNNDGFDDIQPRFSFRLLIGGTSALTEKL